MEKHDENVNVSLTKEQKALLDKASSYKCLSIATFIRSTSVEKAREILFNQKGDRIN